MINKFVTTAIITALLFTACANQEQTPESQASINESKNHLQYKSIVNSSGQELQMAYDTTGTLNLVFNSDTMLLHQDTVASGIKYSNEMYQYREWHGEITLDSNGITLFALKPSK